MKYRGLEIILAFVLIFGVSHFVHANELINRVIDGHAARMIKVVPGSGYHVVVSASNTGTSLKSLVDAVGGVSGVNGAFFCPRDYKQCNGVSFTNALRIMNGDGKTYSKYYPDTGINGLFGFDASGKPILLKQSLWSGDGTTNFGTGAFDSIQNGMANFPIYLHAGRDMLSLYRDDIDAKMKAKTLKNFICAKQDGTILMGGIEGVSVFDMPNLLRRFDCVDAVNLDTGGSTAMMSDGKYVRGPGRDIMDAFVVVKDTPSAAGADASVTAVIARIRTQISGISAGDQVLSAELKKETKAKLLRMSLSQSDAAKKAFYRAISEGL